MLIGWVLADNVGREVQLRRMARLNLFLQDILLELPASTVDIERAHANLQVDASAHKSVPKRPTSIQADSYVMGATLAHAHLSKHLESEIFGERGKLLVQRLLRSRRLETAAPGNGLQMARPNINEDGFVRKRTGLLKGLLSVSQLRFGSAGCCEQTKKSRSDSVFEAEVSETGWCAKD